ncbi:hypothetical protein [Mucilaginibacter sp. UR6-1]|nr:hypothetical protein [Mucilaginibacter sp. UR6-1]
MAYRAGYIDNTGYIDDTIIIRFANAGDGWGDSHKRGRNMPGFR